MQTCSLSIEKQASELWEHDLQNMRICLLNDEDMPSLRKAQCPTPRRLEPSGRKARALQHEGIVLSPWKARALRHEGTVPSHGGFVHGQKTSPAND